MSATIASNKNVVRTFALAVTILLSSHAYADGGPCVSRGIGPYQRASLYNKCDKPRVAVLNYVLINGSGATYYCLVDSKKKRLVDLAGASVVTVLDDMPKDDHTPADSSVCRPPQEQ